VKLPSEDSVQNAQNGPSSQLSKTTSCIEKSNTTIGAEELIIFLVSNANNGQKLVKVLSFNESC
jgi:hypothetical protein